METGRSTLFQGRKFSVDRLAFQSHSGNVCVHEVVVHPGAAVVLAWLDERSIVMIRNQRPAVGERLLELPAGTLDPGEAPVECARRELAEETGYHAAELESLGAFYTSPGICTERMHAFVARRLRPGEQRLEATESIEVVAMTWADALAAVRDGRIRDGKTIAALFLHDARRRR